MLSGSAVWCRIHSIYAQSSSYSCQKAPIQCTANFISALLVFILITLCRCGVPIFSDIQKLESVQKFALKVCLRTVVMVSFSVKVEYQNSQIAEKF